MFLMFFGAPGRDSNLLKSRLGWNLAPGPRLAPPPPSIFCKLAAFVKTYFCKKGKTSSMWKAWWISCSWVFRNFSFNSGWKSQSFAHLLAQQKPGESFSPHDGTHGLELPYKILGKPYENPRKTLGNPKPQETLEKPMKTLANPRKTLGKTPLRPASSSSLPRKSAEKINLERPLDGFPRLPGRGRKMLKNGCPPWVFAGKNW